MIRISRYRPILVALAMVLALVAGAGVATANHQDDTDDSDWFEPGVSEDASLTDRVLEGVANRISQARKGAAKAASMSPLSDNESTAEEYAHDGIEVFNANNGTILTWANTHLAGDEDHEVFEVEFTDRDDATASAYVIAEYDPDQGEYVSARAVDEDEFESIDREIDASVPFGWYASENAADELETWLDRFGEDNEPMTAGYRVDMLTKYADDVEHDLA